MPRWFLGILGVTPEGVPNIPGLIYGTQGMFQASQG